MDVIPKENLKLLIDHIDQLSNGDYSSIEIPEDLPEDYKLIIKKLVDLKASITKNIEKGIQKSIAEEDRYKHLVENVPFCIHEIDKEGKILRINPFGLSLMGAKSQNEVCGKKYLDLIDNQNRKPAGELLTKAFNGEHSTRDFDVGTHDKRRVLRVSFAPIWTTKKNGAGTKEITKVMGITQDITESALTKQALEESRKNLRMVIDSIEEIVYSIDFSHSDPKYGDIVYLSPQVERVLGYNVDDFVENTGLWYSIIHPEDKEDVAESTKALLNEKKPVTRFYRLLHKKTKQYLWFEDKVSPRFNNTGDVCGFIGGARDITERKHTEQALANSEEQYRTLFEKAPIGIGLADMQGNLLAFNDAMMKPGNYTHKDVRNIKNVSAFYYDPGSRNEILQEMLRDGFINQKEIKFRKKDGSPYHALMSLTTLNLDGQPYTMALVKDITESKEIQEALLESQARNKTIVENVHEAIVVFESKTKKFIDFNTNALNLLGYSKEELANMTPAQLSPKFQPGGKSSEELAEEKISKALAGESQFFEWVHRDKSGRDFFCEIHLTSIPYKDHLVVMASIVDITERKQAEIERENLIKELDRFVYSASHDLSAPLKSILGLINITRLESTEHQVLGYLDKIEQSINKLEDFIREIIQYSRNARLEVQIETLELETLVKEILDDLKFTDGYSKIKFKLDFKKLPKIDTDRFRLRVVLNNLLSNSIKFHRKYLEDEAFVKIRGYQSGNSSVIQVIDNGEGIKKENLENIFDMFYRGTHSTSGSGLGLYIAKEAAQNIKGKIDVESEFGKGTTFSIKISHPLQ